MLRGGSTGPDAHPRGTFVIDTDRRVLDVVSSEIRMNTHADRALEVLRAHGPETVRGSGLKRQVKVSVVERMIEAWPRT